MFIIFNHSCNGAFTSNSLEKAYNSTRDEFEWEWEDLEVYEIGEPIETEIKVVRKQTVVKKER